jgi:uncharacterized membrane protein YuzA (DUF378 family)
MKIKDTNIFNTVESVFGKKPMVKSVIYLLFSYAAPFEKADGKIVEKEAR